MSDQLCKKLKEYENQNLLKKEIHIKNIKMQIGHGLIFLLKLTN